MIHHVDREMNENPRLPGNTKKLIASDAFGKNQIVYVYQGKKLS